MLAPFLGTIFPHDSEINTLLNTANGSALDDLALEGVLGQWPRVSRPVVCCSPASAKMGTDIPLTYQTGGSQSSSSSMRSITFQPDLRNKLPMIIKGLMFPAIADSGCEENLISFSLVEELGLLTSVEESRQKFRPPHGGIIHSLGQLTLDCAFFMEPDVQLSCSFHVIWSQIRRETPLTMGMSFLDKTETLTKNKHRLVDTSWTSPARIYSINSPKRRLRCTVGGQVTLANADTGSDTNLISLDYVKVKGFRMTPANHLDRIQFIDGETSQLVGKMTLPVRLAQSMPEINVHFYVFKDLFGGNCDLLLGSHFLLGTNAFSTYRSSFEVTELNDDVSELNHIAWFNTIERLLARFRLRSHRCASDSIYDDLTDGISALCVYVMGTENSNIHRSIAPSKST